MVIINNISRLTLHRIGLQIFWSEYRDKTQQYFLCVDRKYLEQDNAENRNIISRPIIIAIFI